MGLTVMWTTQPSVRIRSSSSNSFSQTPSSSPASALFKLFTPGKVVIRCVRKEEAEPLLEGMPEEFYDDEWQAKQRERTKEWHKYRREEEMREEEKIEEYREIATRLKGYPEEDVRKARKLVSDFIRSEEEVEEKIVEAAERGELNELVLMVIWNRLELARNDEERDAVRALDLLYRRVETEISKREASLAMRLLNDLLNLHDGVNDVDWLNKCQKLMADTFPREDPFSLVIPMGFDIDKLEGPLRPPVEVDDPLLRVDFVREVDALLKEVRSEKDEEELDGPELDPESVAQKLKLQQKQKIIRQVEALLDLAINLKW